MLKKFDEETAIREKLETGPNKPDTQLYSSVPQREGVIEMIIIPFENMKKKNFSLDYFK